MKEDKNERKKRWERAKKSERRERMSNTFQGPGDNKFNVNGFKNIILKLRHTHTRTHIWTAGEN